MSNLSAELIVSDDKQVESIEKTRKRLFEKIIATSASKFFCNQINRRIQAIML